MANHWKSQSQSKSKRATKVNELSSFTKATLSPPLSISMNHSEPECEILRNEGMRGENSELHPDSSSFDIEETHQRRPIDAVQSELSYLPKSLAVQGGCKTASLCTDQKSNNIPLEIEDEIRAFAQQEDNANANEAPNEGSPNRSTEEIVNKDEECTYSSIDSPRESPKECCSIKLDDCTSTADAEDEEDDFFIHFFDTTLDAECDSSFSLDLEGTDSEIQLAVREIRNQAEKMDTMMILDQLKTLQTEYDSITKKCSATCLANEDLKIQLQESEDKVAHMELERDLHQADAMKLREDLKTIVSKMFDISMYEHAESANDKTKVESAQNDDSRTQGDQDTSSSSSSSSTNQISFPGIPHGNTTLNAHGTSKMPERMRIIGLVDKPRQVVRRTSRSSDPSVLRMFPSSPRFDFVDTDNICLLPPSPHNQLLRNQHVFRTRNNHKVDRPRTKSVPMKQREYLSPDGRKKEMMNMNLRRHQSLSAIDTKSTILTTETKLEEDEKENRRCGMLFRRRSKRRSFSSEDVSLLKHQIQQLQGLMNTSLGSSEKLRKRISTITRYYEGVIGKLQTKVADVKAEKSRTEVYLTNKISQLDLERRLVVSKFEHELHRRDQEIARLKVVSSRGEV